MSANARKHWLLGYDIRDAKRLRRIHAYLSKRGYPLQYSVFGLELTDPGIRSILDELAILMDPDVDDIRAYHLPERCKVWVMGRQACPEGVELHATQVMRLLTRPAKGLASGQLDLFPDGLASPWRAGDFGVEEPERLPRLRGD